MSLEQKEKRGSKATKRAFIILGVVVLVALAVLLVFFNQQRKAQKTIDSLELVEYKQETLVSSISGSGTVRANQDALLVWGTSGTVSRVTAVLGDKVSRDELLIRLSDDDLPLDILQAKLEKLNAEKALNDLESSTTVRRAQLNADIANAEKAVDALQTELDVIESRSCTSWRLNDLQNTYDDALEAYQDNSTEFNVAKLNAAKVALDFCKPESLEQQAAEKQAMLTLQEENLNRLKADLAKIKDGPDPEEREKLELSLEIANKRLSAVELKAPFDGTVTALYNAEGDKVNAGMQAVQISDISRLFIEAPISEVDIPMVKVGQAVDLVFDAFFEETYQGVVTEVSQLGVNQQGVINYIVTIELENGLGRLQPGMTAGVTIKIEEKANVFVVPSEAISTENGVDVVFVLRDGKTVSVPVTLGAYSNRNVEILEADIEAGEQIVVNPPSSILDAVGGFGPGMGFGR